MHKLTNQSGFSAAHQLINPQGECGNLPGHKWKVEVTVTASKLDRAEMGVDFKLLKREAGHVVQELDHKYLNEDPAFSEISPSFEPLGRALYQKIGLRIHNDSVKIDSVTLWDHITHQPAIMSDRA
jgi:6-pyruvoyltetrahydropterin/6-carboxytetrahydropterin synthase